MYTNYNGGNEIPQNHNATLRDSHTPLKTDGRPVDENVWKYFLGINDGLTSIQAINHSHPLLFPNPATEYFGLPNTDAKQVVICDLKGKKVLTASW